MAHTSAIPRDETEATGGAHGNALTALAYGSMVAQTAISTASTHRTVTTSAKSMVARGREIGSGERELKTSRVGKAHDKAAIRAAKVASGPAADAVRNLSATNLGMSASKAASIAAKFAMPVMIGKAVFEAGRGYSRDGIKGAILGAGDSLAFGRATASLNGWEKGGASGAIDGLTFGLMSWAARHAPESLRGATRATAPSKSNDAGDTSTPNRLDAKEAKGFEKADAARQASASRHTEPPVEKPASTGLIGFQNPTTMQAALAAQGKTLKNEPVVRTA